MNTLLINTITEAQRIRLFIIGDDRLKLSKKISQLILGPQLAGIDVYDPLGKIDFTCGKMYSLRKQIVERFWIALGLEDFIRSTLLKKDKMNELNQNTEEAEDLKEEMTETIDVVLEDFDIPQSNKYMNKWIEKIRNLNVSELIRDYPEITIPPLINFVEGLPNSSMEQNYLFVIVSNKIIVNNLWNDTLDYIYNSDARLIIFESTKDRLSIENLLLKTHFTKQYQIIELRKTKKYSDKLIKINF